MNDSAEPKNIKAALLNEAGVFQKMVEVPESELTALHIPMEECDLPADSYRWDFEQKHFVPLKKKKGTENPFDEAATMRAVALGFIAVRDAGIALPKETLDWLAYYSTSFDFKG